VNAGVRVRVSVISFSNLCVSLFYTIRLVIGMTGVCVKVDFGN